MTDGDLFAHFLKLSTLLLGEGVVNFSIQDTEIDVHSPSPSKFFLTHSVNKKSKITEGRFNKILVNELLVGSFRGDL